MDAIAVCIVIAFCVLLSILWGGGDPPSYP